jgi:hypothetical protein
MQTYQKYAASLQIFFLLNISFAGETLVREKCNIIILGQIGSELNSGFNKLYAENASLSNFLI